MPRMVVMGVPGCGESLIGRAIAGTPACPLLDAARRALRPVRAPPGGAADRAP